MKNVIFYGAGEFGRQMAGFLRYMGYDGNYYFADKNARNIGEIDGIVVKTPEECIELGYPFLVLIRDRAVSDTVISDLNERECHIYPDVAAWVKDSGIDLTEWHRNYVAFVHIDDMQDYYLNAERDDNMNIFWGKSSPFYELFVKLDLKNVVELACGHGRHVTQYISNAENIVLVDVLIENIDYCRKRFSAYENIRYYHNNGRDLCEIQDNSCSSIFSYDAMVHFEMMDIWSYLKEFYRILTKGGYALVHHSNRSEDPLEEAFENSAHSRSFMSKNLFAYMAHRAGFSVEKQIVINWGAVEGLDCISLIKKI